MRTASGSYAYCPGDLARREQATYARLSIRHVYLSTASLRVPASYAHSRDLRRHILHLGEQLGCGRAMWMWSEVLQQKEDVWWAARALERRGPEAALVQAPQLQGAQASYARGCLTVVRGLHVGKLCASSCRFGDPLA